ncbi:MAG: putative DNA-binding domain-containing protein [Rhodospirillales bacterium]|nr:putative DNA-binding domain-containing protein [Rhodospirillales bacterium]
MPPRLHEIQQAFGAAIFADDARVAEHVVADGIAAVDRLRVYRNTAFSVLTDALRLTYPAVDRLVGTAFFDGAAAAFIRQHPPKGAYLTEYGAAFADFLAAFPPAAEIGYLPDVARFEWALNIAANAPDARSLDPAILATFNAAEHDDVRFTPHPSLGLPHLDHPADAIADAVLAGDEVAMAAVDPSSGPVWLVVHRGPEGVEARRLTEAEWRLTECLCAGLPLGPMLDAHSDVDAARLLTDHLARGRFAGFDLIRPCLEASS